MKALFIMNVSSYMPNNYDLSSILKKYRVNYKIIKNKSGTKFAIEYNANKSSDLNLRKFVENSCKKFGHSEYVFIVNRKGIVHKI